MSEVRPQVNGLASPTGKYIDHIDPDDPEYIKNLQRPAEVKEDLQQMENRSRVSHVLNSQAFKEELEQVVEEQLRNGPYPASLIALQQITDLLLPHSKGSLGSLARASVIIPINDLRGVESLGFAKGEKLLRCKVAGLYRLVDLCGWSHGIHNHITARVSSENEHFLINPFGMTYSEVTASSLIKVDVNGEILEPGSSNLGAHRAGFSVHSAIHQARPDIKCIVHLHTPVAVAVSALKCGLLPISQEALICGNVSYHDFQGVTVDTEEREKLARNLGVHNKILILRNRGILACGETVEEAFHYAFNVMAACEAQVRALPLGLENIVVPTEEAQKQVHSIASQSGKGGSSKERKWKTGELEFEALMRTLDNSGYRTGYVYKNPVVKQERRERSNSDVEIPPSSSSFTYIFDGDYEHSKYASPIKAAMERQKAAFRAGWLTTPNSYKKTELEEIGTTTPKKITKWVSEGDSPGRVGVPPVRIENPNQFAPQGDNPKEFKEKQKSIRKDYYEEKITAGPQSKILEGITWDEAQKAKDGQLSGTADQIIVVGAASKGIIQRDHQHNVIVYRQFYGANPFENMSETEIAQYQAEVEQKERGEPVVEEQVPPTMVEMVDVPASQEPPEPERPDTEVEETRPDTDELPETVTPESPQGHCTPHEEQFVAQLNNEVLQTNALPARQCCSQGQQTLNVVEPILKRSAVGQPLMSIQASCDSGNFNQQQCFEKKVLNSRSESDALNSDEEDIHGGENSKFQRQNSRHTCADEFNNLKNTWDRNFDKTAGEVSEEMRWHGSGTFIPEDDFVTVQLNPLQLYHGRSESGFMKVRFSVQSTVRRRIRAELSRGGPIEEIYTSVSEPFIEHFEADNGSFEHSEVFMGHNTHVNSLNVRRNVTEIKQPIICRKQWEHTPQYRATSIENEKDAAWVSGRSYGEEDQGTELCSRDDSGLGHDHNERADVKNCVKLNILPTVDSVIPTGEPASLNTALEGSVKQAPTLNETAGKEGNKYDVHTKQTAFTGSQTATNEKPASGSTTVQDVSTSSRNAGSGREDDGSERAALPVSSASGHFTDDDEDDEEDLMYADEELDEDFKLYRDQTKGKQETPKVDIQTSVNVKMTAGQQKGSQQIGVVDSKKMSPAPRLPLFKSKNTKKLKLKKRIKKSHLSLSPVKEEFGGTVEEMEEMEAILENIDDSFEQLLISAEDDLLISPKSDQNGYDESLDLRDFIGAAPMALEEDFDFSQTSQLSRLSNSLVQSEVRTGLDEQDSSAVCTLSVIQEKHDPAQEDQKAQLQEPGAACSEQEASDENSEEAVAVCGEQEGSDENLEEAVAVCGEQEGSDENLEEAVAVCGEQEGSDENLEEAVAVCGEQEGSDENLEEAVACEDRNSSESGKPLQTLVFNPQDVVASETHCQANPLSLESCKKETEPDLTSVNEDVTVEIHNSLESFEVQLQSEIQDPDAEYLILSRMKEPDKNDVSSKKKEIRSSKRRSGKTPENSDIILHKKMEETPQNFPLKSVAISAEGVKPLREVDVNDIKQSETDIDGIIKTTSDIPVKKIETQFDYIKETERDFGDRIPSRKLEESMEHTRSSKAPVMSAVMKKAAKAQHKQLLNIDEGPVQTSSPKLGRAKSKESPFKSYHRKLGKSEETLLDIMPLKGQKPHFAAKSHEELEDKANDDYLKSPLSRSTSLGPHHVNRKNRTLLASHPQNKSKETLIDDFFDTQTPGKEKFQLPKVVLDRYNLMKHNEMMELSSARSVFKPPVTVDVPVIGDVMPPLPDTTEVPSISDTEGQSNMEEYNKNDRLSRTQRSRGGTAEAESDRNVDNSASRRKWVPKPKRPRRRHRGEEGQAAEVGLGRDETDGLNENREERRSSENERIIGRQGHKKKTDVDSRKDPMRTEDVQRRGKDEHARRNEEVHYKKEVHHKDSSRRSGELRNDAHEFHQKRLDRDQELSSDFKDEYNNIGTPIRGERKEHKKRNEEEKRGVGEYKEQEGNKKQNNRLPENDKMQDVRREKQHEHRDECEDAGTDSQAGHTDKRKSWRSGSHTTDARRHRHGEKYDEEEGSGDDEKQEWKRNVNTRIHRNQEDSDYQNKRANGSSEGRHRHHDRLSESSRMRRDDKVEVDSAERNVYSRNEEQRRRKEQLRSKEDDGRTSSGKENWPDIPAGSFYNRQTSGDKEIAGEKGLSPVNIHPTSKHTELDLQNSPRLSRRHGEAGTRSYDYSRRKEKQKYTEDGRDKIKKTDSRVRDDSLGDDRRKGTSNRHKEDMAREEKSDVTSPEKHTQISQFVENESSALKMSDISMVELVYSGKSGSSSPDVFEAAKDLKEEPQISSVEKKEPSEEKRVRKKGVVMAWTGSISTPDGSDDVKSIENKGERRDRSLKHVHETFAMTGREETRQQPQKRHERHPPNADIDDERVFTDRRRSNKDSRYASPEVVSEFPIRREKEHQQPVRRSWREMHDVHGSDEEDKNGETEAMDRSREPRSKGQHLHSTDPQRTTDDTRNDEDSEIPGSFVRVQEPQKYAGFVRRSGRNARKSRPVKGVSLDDDGRDDKHGDDRSEGSRTDFKNDRTDKTGSHSETDFKNDRPDKTGSHSETDSDDFDSLIPDNPIEVSLDNSIDEGRQSSVKRGIFSLFSCVSGRSAHVLSRTERSNKKRPTAYYEEGEKRKIKKLPRRKDKEEKNKLYFEKLTDSQENKHSRDEGDGPHGEEVLEEFSGESPALPEVRPREQLSNLSRTGRYQRRPPSFQQAKPMATFADPAEALETFERDVSSDREDNLNRWDREIRTPEAEESEISKSEDAKFSTFMSFDKTNSAAVRKKRDKTDHSKGSKDVSASDKKDHNKGSKDVSAADKKDHNKGSKDVSASDKKDHNKGSKDVSAYDKTDHSIGSKDVSAYDKTDHSIGYKDVPAYDKTDHSKGYKDVPAYDKTDHSKGYKDVPAYDKTDHSKGYKDVSACDKTDHSKGYKDVSAYDKTDHSNGYKDVSAYDKTDHSKGYKDVPAYDKTDHSKGYKDVSAYDKTDHSKGYKDVPAYDKTDHSKGYKDVSAYDQKGSQSFPVNREEELEKQFKTEEASKLHLKQGLTTHEEDHEMKNNDTSRTEAEPHSRSRRLRKSDILPGDPQTEKKVSSKPLEISEITTEKDVGPVSPEMPEITLSYYTTDLSPPQCIELEDFETNLDISPDEYHPLVQLNSSAPAHFNLDNQQSAEHKQILSSAYDQTDSPNESHHLDTYFDPSASFDAADLHYRRHHRTVSFDDKLHPAHRHRHVSETSIGAASATSRPRSSSATSNPLTHEPWRVKAYRNKRSLSTSEMGYGKGGSKPSRAHSIGEMYSSTVASSVAKRRARTHHSSDITSRMYQPRQLRSRSFLGDTSFGSAGPTRHRSFSGFDHTSHSSDPIDPVVTVRRSESARTPSKSPQLVEELTGKNIERTKSDHRPKLREELAEDKATSPGKSDTVKSTDSASGGETLEERSSKEGSPTKEHPPQTKEKKKKKKFRIPSFSKKKSKENKESSI